MYLSDRDLLAELGQTWNVSPFNPEHLGSCSYDFTLSNEFTHPDEGGIIYTDEWTLQPGDFILACTEEILTLTPLVLGVLHGRSSFGRLGLQVHATAGFADAGYYGRLTLEMELSAGRRAPLRLRRGWRIAQLAVSRLSSPAEHPYQGKYQGDVGVQRSRLAEEQEASVGVIYTP